STSPRRAGSVGFPAEGGARRAITPAPSMPEMSAFERKAVRSARTWGTTRRRRHPRHATTSGSGLQCAHVLEVDSRRSELMDRRPTRRTVMTGGAAAAAALGVAGCLQNPDPSRGGGGGGTEKYTEGEVPGPGSVSVLGAFGG